MGTKLLGRCLIRRAKTTADQEIIMLVGAFLPQNVSIDTFDKRDEMWIVEFEEISHNTIRLVNASNKQFSPEDFLENIDGIQDVREWEAK